MNLRYFGGKIRVVEAIGWLQNVTNFEKRYKVFPFGKIFSCNWMRGFNHTSSYCTGRANANKVFVTLRRRQTSCCCLKQCSYTLEVEFQLSEGSDPNYWMDVLVTWNQSQCPQCKSQQDGEKELVTAHKMREGCMGNGNLIVVVVA